MNIKEKFLTVYQKTNSIGSKISEVIILNLKNYLNKNISKFN